MENKQEVFINYPIATELLNVMDDLLNVGAKYRMPNILIYGDSNNGKTEILLKFCKDNPGNINPLIDNVFTPVIYTECCVVPDEKRIYTFILNAVNVHVKPHSIIDHIKSMALNALISLGCRVLIIDEIHHILNSSPAKQRASMATIKHVSNLLKIPIVLAGTKDAVRIVNADEQLQSRFPQYELPKWKKDIDYVKLLKAFIEKFDGKDSKLTIDKEFASAIFNRSKGVLGMTSRIMKFCVEENKGTLDENLISKYVDYKP